MYSSGRGKTPTIEGLPYRTTSPTKEFIVPDLNSNGSKQQHASGHRHFLRVQDAMTRELREGWILLPSKDVKHVVELDAVGRVDRSAIQL